MTESLDADRVDSVASRLGLGLDSGILDRLTRYGDLFLRWNERINLGGRISADELVERHFLDAFAVARFVGLEDSVVDVGSGGGLPVIPLALVREKAAFEIYEPIAKKVAFLRTVVRELGLGSRVKIRPEKVQEALAPALVRRFDVATSRATFSPSKWLGMGRNLVRRGGKVIAFGTDEDPGECPTPLEELRYALNRRLLVFTAP